MLDQLEEEAVAVAHESSFEKDGFVIARNLISTDVLAIAFRYYLSYVSVDGYYEVREMNRAFDRYADALSEAMMPVVQRRLENETGLTLLPTYSFARIYTTESKLSKHVDRGACEVSATMTVGYKNSAALWPICVEHEGKRVPIELDVGDALIYRGMDLPHWREKLPSGLWCQIFFHFVDANGALAASKYDGRGRMGPVNDEYLKFRATPGD